MLIKLGTIEVFQGQEKDVVIISGVRSQEAFLKHDKRFKIGLIGDFKRMNVSISRAKELLVFIGNVKIFKTDK